MVSKAAEMLRRTSRDTLPLSVSLNRSLYRATNAISAVARPEARLKWIQGICFIQMCLKLISHHPLDHFAHERNIGNGPIIANFVRRQTRLLSYGPNECLLEDKGNLPSRKDPIIIAMAHSVVVGLAALISQARQGSREEVVARQRSSTLATVSGITG